MPGPDALTPRQREIYQFIRSEVQGRSYGPTVREIGMHFQIKSPIEVMCHLKALQKKGLIHREPNMSRAIKLRQDLTRACGDTSGPLTPGELLHQYLGVREFKAMGIDPTLSLKCSDCLWQGEVIASTLLEFISLLQSKADRDFTCESCNLGRYAAWRPKKRRRDPKTMPYSDYLLSANWRRRRERSVEAAGHRRQLCNAPASANPFLDTYPLDSPLLSEEQPLHQPRRWEGLFPLRPRPLALAAPPAAERS